jgi:hypothetical protein
VGREEEYGNGHQFGETSEIEWTGAKMSERGGEARLLVSSHFTGEDGKGVSRCDTL